MTDFVIGVLEVISQVFSDAHCTWNNFLRNPYDKLSSNLIRGQSIVNILPHNFSQLVSYSQAFSYHLNSSLRLLFCPNVSPTEVCNDALTH